MLLTPEEFAWATERMTIYDVKYQEIYNEIFDHILSSIEQKRLAGDIRGISVLFQTVVDDDFGGYLGIEELAAKQERTYNTYMRGSFRRIIGGYFSWKPLLFAAAAFGLSFTMPDTKLFKGIMLAAIALFAFTPLIYGFVMVSRKVKVAKGKRSLLKAHLLTQTYLPAMFLNAALYLPSFFFLGDDNASGFKLFQHQPTPVLMLVLLLFMMLNAAAISLCTQMLNRKNA